MVAKIALEEHFLSPGFETYWHPTVTTVPPQVAAAILGRLTDFGSQRLESMDQAGIARAVLSIAGPGVQSERDAATACKNARASNDFLAGESGEVGGRRDALRALADTYLGLLGVPWRIGLLRRSRGLAADRWHSRYCR